MGYIFFPKFELVGEENLPESSCMIIGNHSQVYGPVSCELYMKEKFKIWCACDVMDKKIIKDYAYEEFWGRKPKAIKWFFYLISRTASWFTSVFTDAHTLPVYRGMKIMTTYKLSIQSLEEGYNNVMFAENYNPHNNIVNEFKQGFVDLARIYYTKTGKKISFVPMYIAPELRKIFLCEPIEFIPELSPEEERTRITGYLMDKITEKASELPLHKVVPFANTTKEDWGYNTPIVDYTKKEEN